MPTEQILYLVDGVLVNAFGKTVDPADEERRTRPAAVQDYQGRPTPEAEGATAGQPELPITMQGQAVPATPTDPVAILAAKLDQLLTGLGLTKPEEKAQATVRPRREAPAEPPAPGEPKNLSELDAATEPQVPPPGDQAAGSEGDEADLHERTTRRAKG